MIKSIKKVFLIVLLLGCTIFLGIYSQAVLAASAEYVVVKNITNEEIGYGITHIKDKATSSSQYYNDEAHPQSVNILNVPSKKDVRIINWTYSNKAGWTKQTVRNMAYDFEQKNPGWIVLAAVNGDFFDINGNNKVLPYQTSGVAVSNGDVLRPIASGSTVGFKNDGSDHPLVGNQKFTTDKHYLSIFDENNNVIYSKVISNINSEPKDNDVSVWYGYRDDNKILNSVNVSDQNTFIVQYPVRVLPMSTDTVYAKGLITSINEQTTIRYGQFAIQTSDPEILSLLSVGKMIRVQKQVIGDYADCTEATGAGMVLVENGIRTDASIGDKDRHPRTMVGMKEDGTIVFATVDGRQQTSNMYGMTSEEMAATMIHYGCTEAYNLDGGGSTTMIIRNNYGDFDVVNSPSDGSERNDSNTLLVVVPEINFTIKEVTDTEVIFDYVKPINGVEISNLQIMINDEVKTNLEFPYVWEGLSPNTSYKIDATYKLNYNGIEKDMDLRPINFKTGYEKMKLFNYCYVEREQDVVVYYDITDENDVLILASITSGSYFDILDINNHSLVIPKSMVNLNDIIISIEYNVKSSTKQHSQEDYKVNKEYGISYNLDGGINSIGAPEHYKMFEESIGLPTPTKEGFTFLGWYIGEEKQENINTANGENITLTARWEKTIIKHKINFVLEDGIMSLNAPTEFIEGDGLAILPTPTKDGYNFLGWYIGNEKQESISAFETTDIVLTARWEKNEEVKKKGCKKSSGEYMIATLSAISLLVLIIRKKK